MSDSIAGTVAPKLPTWASELIAQYESDAASQFVLYGNVNDRLVLPLGGGVQVGGLTTFLLKILLARFDVVLSYDIGNGIRVEKGQEIFYSWPRAKDTELPKAPRAAIETLTHYFRYTANLAALGQSRKQVGCIITAADMVAPNAPSGLSYDLNALALLMREWAADPQLASHALATFLIAENLNDLHPLIANSSRAARVKVPLPGTDEIGGALSLWTPRFPAALKDYSTDLGNLAEHLSGATLGSVESLLKTKEHAKQGITSADLSQLKKQLVENDSNGLIEFIDPSRTLDDLYGQEKIKAWLRQDIALWQKNELDAMPMGYLICGPVGTGKTYMVECLAGEAGVPVVKLKNFRDKWVGSTEGNLERIFRLLHALGRCVVFIDEADQALGKRDSGNSDSGLSGRVYSMLAEEMGQTRNRGKILWALASSRPDLIEVDLKRPGRIDVKIPIFPTTTPEESFALIRGLCKKRGMSIPETTSKSLMASIPTMMTPGAAETLAVKVFRMVKTQSLTPLQALKEVMADYQNPIPPDVMRFQIDIAAREASDLDFVPKQFRVTG